MQATLGYTEIILSRLNFEMLTWVEAHCEKEGCIELTGSNLIIFLADVRV